MHFSVLACIFLLFIDLNQGEATLQSDWAQDESFKKWCAEFCESDDGEYLARIYPTWRANADYVADHNRLGLSYSLALNRFSHLNRNEFSGRFLRPKYAARTTGGAGVTIGRDPPSSVDWRKKGVVPPVQNQGQCGGAVSFSLVHSVDSLHALETGTLELASVEEFADCCTQGPCVGELYGIQNYDCIVEKGGLALSSVYVSPDHKCLNDTFKPAIKIKGGKYVNPQKNETALEYAVAQQPVVTAIDASRESFQLYESGVYYDPDCSSTELDHAVLVVGYGTTEDGMDYWICQNSWGLDWGMQGYVYMARNRGNNCGIATEAMYPF